MINNKINEGKFVDALGRAAQSVPTAKKKPATVPQQSQEQKPIEQPIVQEPTQVPAGWKVKSGTRVTLKNKSGTPITYRVSNSGNWVMPSNDRINNQDLKNSLNLEAYKIEWREQQKSQSKNKITESIKNRWKLLAGIKG